MLLGDIMPISIIPAWGIPEYARSLNKLFCFMANKEPTRIDTILIIAIIIKIWWFNELLVRALKKKIKKPIIDIFGMVLKNGSMFIGADS